MPPKTSELKAPTKMQGSIIILDRCCEIPYKQVAVLADPGLSYKLSVKGLVLDDPSQFAINIADETGAILIHVNPRWSEDRVVVNSYNTKMWGRQEYGELNLKENETFDIGIKDKGEFFWVTINHEVEIQYRKRIKPASSLRLIQVCKVEREDISLHSVQMDEFFD